MKNKFRLLILIIFFMSLFLSTCGVQKSTTLKNYEGRVYYEIFVRSFNDSDGDGIGDLKGVTQKLDYLKDLGVQGLWLMPICASPSYHGYDVSDYYSINSDYGTMEDLQNLIKEAHKIGINVTMDLVLNHTSTQNKWFIDAATDANSKYRNYYIWSDETTDVNSKSSMGTIQWYLKNGFYYNAVFWDQMPDLNYDNAEVRVEAKKIAKFYLDKGIDGFRLDAAMHIYNADDNKNVAWWTEFNSYVKSLNKNATIVGEVWANTDTITKYIGALDSTFDFPLANEIVKGEQTGSFAMLSLFLDSIYTTYVDKNILGQDSPFITNHDQNRAMNYFEDMGQAKQAAAILLSLPGTPYIYYGEEIGMKGSGKDEYKREPMLWSSDASKNTSWEADLENDADITSVSVEEKDKNSLLSFYKKMISIRNNNDALKYGSYVAFATENDSIFSIKRELNGKSTYVYVSSADSEQVENLDIASAKIIYSSAGRKGKIKAKAGQITLKPNEILVIVK